MDKLCINVKAKTRDWVERVEMKKKMLECKTHGVTLHRCKLRYWHTAKDKTASDYTEKCFKCIAEGRHKKAPMVQKQSAHIKI